MPSILDPESTTPPTALAESLAFSEEVQAHVAQARNLHALLKDLSAAGLYVQAARLLVRALPRRYAIAWACECFRKDAARAPFNEAESATLNLVERWLAEASEELRQAAADKGALSEYRTATDWLAGAVALTGGSLTPAGNPVVPPGEHMSADACFAALCLLATREPKAFAQRLGGWVERALQVFGSGSERA